MDTEVCGLANGRILAFDMRSPSAWVISGPEGVAYGGALDRFARANRKAGHSRAGAILVFGRIPGRSAGCQGGRAGEAVFTYGLAGTIPDPPRDGERP